MCMFFSVQCANSSTNVMLVSDNILDKNVGPQFSGPFMFFSTVKYEKDSCKCCKQTQIKWSLYTRMCTLKLLLSDKMFV